MNLLLVLRFSSGVYTQCPHALPLHLLLHLHFPSPSPSLSHELTSCNYLLHLLFALHLHLHLLVALRMRLLLPLHLRFLLALHLHSTSHLPLLPAIPPADRISPASLPRLRTLLLCDTHLFRRCNPSQPGRPTHFMHRVLHRTLHSRIHQPDPHTFMLTSPNGLSDILVLRIALSSL